MYCGVALPGSRGVAHRKVSTHRFCAAKLLALKSIGFLMTGKKRRAGMRPHFKRFFRSMAQKDLLLSDACLPLCGRSLLFFCRRFLFQIKRKCRNAESVKSLIIVGREGSKPIINKSKLLYRLRRYRTAARGPYERSVKQAFSKILCRSRGVGASSRRTLQVARQ